ncbi:DUF2254 domain-containing protein [Streptomyces sp. NPDC002602]|uniref:DUF2254 domain-containing protein n=1 Tax=Streptomyces sp. NPDC002602 TaxID=3364654 RepID=UPI00369ECB6C
MPGSADGPAHPGAREGRRRRVPYRRPANALRRDLAQLFCAVVGLVLGLVAPLITLGPQVAAGRVVSVLFTIGFGVVSLVSIIYSMLFLVVQFSSTMFTPRLGLFRDEPIVWRAFAFTVGVFVFCVTSGLAIGNHDSVSAFVPCVAMVLTLIALGLMRSLQMRAFNSIQLGHSLTAIATRAHDVYDGLYPRPYDPDAPPARPDRDPLPRPSDTGAGRTVVRWTGPPAVLQRIDMRTLVGLARDHDSEVAFHVAPGATLTAGTVLAEVTADGPTGEALRAALTAGVERSFVQDPELPFRLLADIALRALSPAVNDPATAVEALDRLEDLLTRLADRDLEIGGFDDPAGRLRVSVPVPDWDRYVRTAVDDVVFAAAGSPMALRRMRDLLRGLAERAPERRRAVLHDRLRWVETTGREAYPLVWTPAEAS